MEILLFVKHGRRLLEAGPTVDSLKSLIDSCVTPCSLLGILGVTFCLFTVVSQLKANAMSNALNKHGTSGTVGLLSVHTCLCHGHSSKKSQ